MSSDHQYIHISLSNLSIPVSNEATIIGASSDSQDQSPPTQKCGSSRPESNFDDGSDTLFSMYNEKALEFDSKLIQNWREDANNVMLLSGLVSAAVAGFLSQSYLSSRTSSQDVTAFYMTELYVLQAVEAGLDSSDFPLDGTPVPIGPPKYSHFLWFLSLVISLGCAVGATLVQEWLRRYLLLTQPGFSPHRCARIRAFITDQFWEFVPIFLTFLNIFLHTSIYLFLFGLGLLTANSGDLPTALVLSISIAFSFIPYLYISVKPISHPNSVLFTPLSSIYGWFTAWLFNASDEKPPAVRLTPHRAAQKFEELASTRTLTLDTGAMSWLLDSLTHEQELERFLTGIPGFYKSTRVEDPAQVLRAANTDTSPKAILAFMDHSLSSDLISDTTKQQRITASLKAIQTDPYLLERTFYHALCFTESAIFKSVDFVLLADQHANDDDPNIRSLARCIIAIAINRLEDYHSDERWAGIVQRRLNWSEAVFAEHRERGDSVKLRNLVRLAWELNTARPGSDTPELHEAFGNSLRAARRLNVDTAAPALQKEFCDLWNQLVVATQVQCQDPVLSSNVMLILSFIYPIYVPLHKGTESQSSALSASTCDLDPVLRDPSSYSQCTVSSHRTITFANSNTDTPVVHDAGDA
ncbi:hypothetical protein H4582DRAFT_1962123 [Lactarius indigo]|nr:hypothetical protein H4582DRAFT_1962123 [Lactarius indigo]